MNIKHYLTIFMRLLNAFVFASAVFIISYTFIHYCCSYFGMQLWKSEFSLLANMITYPLFFGILILIFVLHFYKKIFSFLKQSSCIMLASIAIVITDYIPFKYLNQFYQNIDTILGQAHVLYPVTENALVFFFNSSILYFIFLIYYFIISPRLKNKEKMNKIE